MVSTAVANGVGAISTSNKSRGQLKRLKKKAKAANADASADQTTTTVSFVRSGLSALVLHALICSDAPTNRKPATDRDEARVQVDNDTATTADYVVEELKAPEGFADVFAHFQPPPVEQDEVRLGSFALCVLGLQEADVISSIGRRQ